MTRSDHTTIPPIRPKTASRQSHYFFSSDDNAEFPRLLSLPYQHFIEMNEYLHLSQVLQFIAEEHPHVSLSLTTKTAFSLPVAEFVTRHLAAKRNLPATIASDIRTCLQEAVMNAIIHGNLRMHREYQETQQFQAYLEEITARMEDDVLGMKRVSIYGWFTLDHITLCVADQGNGFTLEQPHDDHDLPYGRGLALIRNLSNAWQTKPNHITMQFRTHA